MDEPKRLLRTRHDRVLAGVCGGMARYLGMDPTIVRVLWVVLSIFPGSIVGGLLVYLVLALVIPEEPIAHAAYPAPYAPPPPPPAP